MSFGPNLSDRRAERTTVNLTIAKGDVFVNDPDRSEGADPKGAIIRR